MSLQFRKKVEQARKHVQMEAGDNNSMYTAFLLDHGDQLKYRLFTGDNGDNTQSGPVDAAGSDATAEKEPATKIEEEDKSATGGVGEGTAPAVGYTKKDDDLSLAVTPNATPAAASTVVGTGWLTLTRRHIHILNITAALVHAMLFLIIYTQAAGKGKQSWRLKRDRLQVINQNVSNAKPFLNITNEKCNLAKPNVMDYGGSLNGTMHLWTYPQVGF